MLSRHNNMRGTSDNGEQFFQWGKNALESVVKLSMCGSERSNFGVQRKQQEQFKVTRTNMFQIFSLPHAVNIYNMLGYRPSVTQRVQSSWVVVCCQEQWRGPSPPAQLTLHSPPIVYWLLQGRGPWLMATSPYSHCTTIISLCVNVGVATVLNTELNHVMMQTWRIQFFWDMGYRTVSSSKSFPYCWEPSKHWDQLTQWHGIASHKTWIIRIKAVRKSYTQECLCNSTNSYLNFILYKHLLYRPCISDICDVSFKIYNLSCWSQTFIATIACLLTWNYVFFSGCCLFVANRTCQITEWWQKGTKWTDQTTC